MYGVLASRGKNYDWRIEEKLRLYTRDALAARKKRTSTIVEKVMSPKFNIKADAVQKDGPLRSAPSAHKMPTPNPPRV